MKKAFVITDNERLLDGFMSVVAAQTDQLKSVVEFHYGYSPVNEAFRVKYKDAELIRPIKIKENVDYLLSTFDLVISLHCKQMFPPHLVRNLRCINVHPGLNPYNRGWFPQVFSIINGLPCGATIHEMDEQLDHGAVICQKEVKIEMWDTSLSVYNKVLDAELELLSHNLRAILDGNYQALQVGEGNLNMKGDFNNLLKIDLSNQDTFLNHINKLRALTHGHYANAYFLDENGMKIYVGIELRRENKNEE